MLNTGDQPHGLYAHARHNNKQRRCNITAKTTKNNKKQQETGGKWTSRFRRGHSTLDGITRLSLALHSAFAQRLVAVGAFIDVEKAYDTVWRLALLVKLHKVGIRGRLMMMMMMILLRNEKAL